MVPLAALSARQRTPGTPTCSPHAFLSSPSSTRSSVFVQLSFLQVQALPIFRCHAVGNALKTFAASALHSFQSASPTTKSVSARPTYLPQHHVLMFKYTLYRSLRAHNLAVKQRHPHPSHFSTCVHQHRALWFSTCPICRLLLACIVVLFYTAYQRLRGMQAAHIAMAPTEKCQSPCCFLCALNPSISFCSKLWMKNVGDSVLCSSIGDRNM